MPGVTEVADLRLREVGVGLGQQNILRFEVAMGYSLIVQVFESGENLHEQESCRSLVQTTSGLQRELRCFCASPKCSFNLTHLTEYHLKHVAVHLLHDDKDLVLCLAHELQSHYAIMTDALQNGHLESRKGIKLIHKNKNKNVCSSVLLPTRFLGGISVIGLTF